MAREIFKIKNISGSNLEIKDFGLIIPSGITIELYDSNKAILSDEIYNYLNTNKIVRVIDNTEISDINYSYIVDSSTSTSKIIDLSGYTGFTNYYLISQANTLFNSKSNTGHTHVTSNITDLSIYSGFTNYYLNTQINTFLNNKSNTGHTHVTNNITDLSGYTNFTYYYIKSQVDTFLNNKLSLSGGTMTGVLTVNSDIRANKFLLGSNPYLVLSSLTNNQSMIKSYWGLQLDGLRQTNTDVITSAFGNNNDYSVLILNSNSSPLVSTLAVIGNGSQTTPLQIWRNDTQDYTASISITGLGTFNGLISNSNTNLTSNLYVTGLTYKYNNVIINGKLGLYQNTPTAYIHLPSGSASAGTSPIKLSEGINMTNPEIGAIEYDGTHLYYTDNIPLRQTLIPSAYGEMYEYNTAGSTITSSPGGSYIGWTTAIVGNINKVTYTNNTTADRLSISSGGDGDYRINFTATVSCSTTRQYKIGVFKNGVQQTKLTIFIRSSSAAIYFPVNITGILSGLVANDYIDIRVAGTNNNDAVRLYTANLSLARINR